MKTQDKPNKTTQTKKSENDQKKTKDNNSGRNPNKPGTDPDQTPEREIENVPVANPNEKND